ncbi:MAG: hypothetical protein ABSD89_02320 [Halobacteriota archaeon]
MVIHGAAYTYCLGRAERLEGSYLRTFALELKEQLAQILAAFVTSVLTGPHKRLDAKEAEEFVKGDPLVLNGMVSKWHISQWTNLLKE